MTTKLPITKCQYCGSEDIGEGWQHGDALVTFKYHGLFGNGSDTSSAAAAVQFCTSVWLSRTVIQGLGEVGCISQRSNGSKFATLRSKYFFTGS